MPDKFPLEHFYRTSQPDAWYEYWQDDDVFYGHSHAPEDDEPYIDSTEEFDHSPIVYGWSGPDYETSYRPF